MALARLSAKIAMMKAEERRRMTEEADVVFNKAAAEAAAKDTKTYRAAVVSPY